MISPFDALELVLANSLTQRFEVLNIFDALGRVCFDNIYSKKDLPPRDNSAMDGYVFSWKDYESGVDSYVVKGVIKAGDAVDNLIADKGECYKIMTGAFIPNGLDTVAEYEIVNEDNGRITFVSSPKKFGHVREKGEDISVGDLIEVKGKEINPYIQARIISSGNAMLKVVKKIKAAVVGTGSELAYPADISDKDKTIDSNSFFIISMLERYGIDCDYLGIVPDTGDELVNIFTNIYDKYDFIVTSAGISAGDFDVVSKSADKIGIKWYFDSVNQKPGKPFSFGMINDTPIFGLPGNPVSSAFCVYFYLLPFVKKSSGYKQYHNICIDAKLEGFFKKKNSKSHFNRVNVVFRNGGFYAVPFESQDSHMIDSILKSNGFAMLTPEMKGEISENSILKVYVYDVESIFTS